MPLYSIYFRRVVCRRREVRCSLFKLVIRLEYPTEICYIVMLTSVSCTPFIPFLFVLNIVIPLLRLSCPLHYKSVGECSSKRDIIGDQG
jgi:hypothetical protein